MIALFGVLVLVAASAAGGWIAGTRIESPAEVAARTAPPTPSPILVPIEERVLSSNVVTRGTAQFGLPQPISLVPSALKANAAGLITTLPTRNAQFKEGDVMFTTSGRPVLVLQGEVPAYRDLVLGISGSDVRQLEQSLKRLGFDPGHIDGTYDEKTGSAVSELYKSAGYVPFLPTAEQVTNIRTLETALLDATKNKMVADSAAAAADLTVEFARSKAQHAEKAATAEIVAGEQTASERNPRQRATSRSATDAQMVAARAALKAAQIDGEMSVQAALEAKKVADFDAYVAAGRLDAAAADLDEARRKLGVQVPVDEIVFTPTLPVRVQEVSAQIGTAVSGPVISVTNNQITIHSSVPLDVAPLIRKGMGVAIDEPSFGLNAKGIVENVASTPGTHGVSGYHIYFTVRVEDTPAALEGFSLRLSIPIKSTKGVVTAVPMSALSLSTNGTSRIQVEDNGSLTYVGVEPGLAANGYVEVTSRDGKLKPGRLVVVGYGNGEKKAGQHAVQQNGSERAAARNPRIRTE
jgi:peptidoglycan hydrolase-like protein with peptidoglycan-binding domain